MLPVLFGYLAGSVPFAFLLARRAGIDVRVAGSGNVGAANVLRTTNAWRGVVVMLLDVAKGASAVLIVSLAAGGASIAALTGAAAIVGHIYPVWLRFHGGKGVAVAAGVFGILTRSRRACGGVVRLDSLADEVRFARFSGRDARAASRGVVVRGAQRGRRRGVRRGRADSVSTSREPSAPLFRHRAKGGDPAMSRIAILGAGSWGTALAIHLARAGHAVRLWARDEALADQMIASRVNATTCRKSNSPRTSVRPATSKRRWKTPSLPSSPCRRTVCARSFGEPLRVFLRTR